MMQQMYTTATANSFDYPPHPHHDPYLTLQDGSQNFTNGFSRGSSTSFTYPHQDYRYFLHRGELASRFCPTSLVDNNNTNNNSLDATGIGFSGNNPFIVPEDISVYNQWDWSPTVATAVPTPVSAPAPIYPSPQQPTFSPSVKSSNRNPPPPSSSSSSSSPSSSSVLCSPTAQLPTPAAMAVLLNPNVNRSSQVAETVDYVEIPQPSAIPVSSVTARPIRPVEPVVAVQGVPDSPSREKKHACTMCHKRYYFFSFSFPSL